MLTAIFHVILFVALLWLFICIAAMVASKNKSGTFGALLAITIWCGSILLSLSFTAAVIYVIIHFASKYW